MIAATILSSVLPAAGVNTLLPVPPGNTITSLADCIAVPVMLTRDSATPELSGFTVTIDLSSQLVFCGVAVEKGTWFTSALAPPVTGTGQTRTISVLGTAGVCSGANGQVLVVHVKAASALTGTGTITVASATATACGGTAPTLTPGSANISIAIPPGSTPDPVAGFEADQVFTGNTPADGTTAIDLNWTAVTGVTVDVYYKAFGNYPEYSDPPAGAVLKKIDFKPGTVATPLGWSEDKGEALTPARGYGWDVNRTLNSTKVRNLIPGDPNDTFFRKKNDGIAIWAYKAPAVGAYSVKVIVGDAFTSCTNNLKVEGTTFFQNKYLTGGHFADATYVVNTGTDGVIQMEIGFIDAAVPAATETKVTAIIISEVGTAAAPTPPVTPGSNPAAEGWTSVGTSLTPVRTVNLPNRDFYYFVAYAKSGTNVSSAVMTGGTLNYHLGDFHNGTAECAGDNKVFDEDFTFFGSHYLRALTAGDALSCLDIAPTTDGTKDGRPTPDNVIDFKDFLIFVQNYGVVSKSFDAPAPFAADALRLATEDLASGDVSAAVLMQGSGRAQGMSVHLEWNPEVVEPRGARAGELVLAQGGVALSGVLGTVDVALRGHRSLGLSGAGTLANLQFRRIGAGDPEIRIAGVEALDAHSQPVDVMFDRGSRVDSEAPHRTAILGNTPNPFNPSTTISFSLGRTGPIEISVYSLAGRRVRVLEKGQREIGLHSVRWDGMDERGIPVASGLYLVQLHSLDGTSSRSVVLVK